MLKPPTGYLPENCPMFNKIGYRKDEKTGLVIFEKESRIAIINELGRVLENGGEIALILYDCDGLKEANDRISHAFGDSNIIWGSCYPLNLLKELNLSCEIIVARPGGSPDETIVFAKKPTQEDKNLISRFVNKLNDPSSGIDITVSDNEGKPRIDTLAVTAGVSFVPADIHDIARRHHMDYDDSPDLTLWSAKDLDEDFRRLKKNDPVGYRFAVIEGMRQVADDRAHEAKGTKQYKLATAWLETLRGYSLEDFDSAEEARFGGARTSRVVKKLINDTRRERYLPGK